MADGTAGLGLSDEERRRAFERSNTVLGLDESQLDLNPTGGPASKSLGLAPQASNAPSFEDLFGNTELGILPKEVGTGPGQVDPEAIFQAGGPQAIQETQRTSMGIGTALDLTDALLGKTTGTQRADPVDLNGFQQTLLWISDIQAAVQGRALPSAQLDQQKWRLNQLEYKNNTQSIISGLSALKEFTDLTSRLPREDRVAAMATQVPRFEKMVPGFGAIGLALADSPTEADAFHAFLATPNLFGGTAAEQLMNYVTALGAVDPARAGTIIENAIKEGGIISQSIDAIGPSVISGTLDAQIETGRSMGGEMADFANRIANADDITPEEYINWESKLPENVKVKDAYLESLGRSPERYLTVFPGMKTAELEELQRKHEVEGEFTNPIAMINTKDPTQIVGGPAQGKRIRNLPDYYVPMNITHEALFPKEAGVAGPFGPPTKATTTDVQKELINLRRNADELIGIQEGYRRNLQTYPAKAWNLYLSAKSGFGGELSPEDQEFRRRFIGNRTRTVTSLSAVLNRLSGAAVSEHEMKRIELTRPAMGDAPDEFEYKLDTSIALNQFAVARMNAWRLIGGPDSRMEHAFNLRREDVRNIVQDTGRAIRHRYRGLYPNATEEQVTRATSKALAKEFGVREQDLLPIISQDPDRTFEGGG